VHPEKFLRIGPDLPTAGDRNLNIAPLTELNTVVCALSSPGGNHSQQQLFLAIIVMSGEMLRLSSRKMINLLPVTLPKINRLKNPRAVSTVNI